MTVEDERGRSVAAQRSTRQKRALAELLAGGGDFLSAQDLHARLHAAGSPVALTTVYSQLRALADTGVVDTVRSEDGETLYRRCATGSHHHHLVCRACGRTVDVVGPAIERWAEEVAAREGFTDVRHTAEITGTCSRCAA